MNFFRALASTLAVAIMGAILLGHLGATLQRGSGGIEVLTQAAGRPFDMAGVFRWVFAAADIFLALALSIVSYSLIEAPFRRLLRKRLGTLLSGGRQRVTLPKENVEQTGF